MDPSNTGIPLISVFMNRKFFSGSRYVSCGIIPMAVSVKIATPLLLDFEFVKTSYFFPFGEPGQGKEVTVNFREEERGGVEDYMGSMGRGEEVL